MSACLYYRQLLISSFLFILALICNVHICLLSYLFVFCEGLYVLYTWVKVKACFFSHKYFNRFHSSRTQTMSIFSIGKKMMQPKSI
jgi:hypothetical protein